ncbi:uncharacterized protein LOC131876565 [Cryptomeria japonica]|uniref:uncharacterized protein LOC131876565 n=1 Tax=Cryptomeria japonica TaxID=3369 RepID=UPI0027DA8EF7|nr:uncharacterized protein LOC131876565 [Cryptomeria japonica]
MAKWIPPPFPSFKLQFDGASNGNPGRSGIGAVIFYHSSKIIEALGKHIGQGTNNVAEFQALSLVLDLTISLNIKDIVIEGESMVVFSDMASILSLHLFLLTQNALFFMESFGQNRWLVAFSEELERAVNMVLQMVSYSVVISLALALDYSMDRSHLAS